MNESIHPDNAASVPWATGDHRGRMPETSMLPDSEKAPQEAVGLLKNTVQGARSTVRSRPIVAIAAALALGAAISRMGRIARRGSP